MEEVEVEGLPHEVWVMVMRWVVITPTPTTSTSTITPTPTSTETTPATTPTIQATTSKHDLVSLVKAGEVSTYFHSLANDSLIWRQLYADYFITDDLLDCVKRGNTWKDLYKKRRMLHVAFADDLTKANAIEFAKEADLYYKYGEIFYYASMADRAPTRQAQIDLIDVGIAEFATSLHYDPTHNRALNDSAMALQDLAVLLGNHCDPDNELWREDAVPEVIEICDVTNEYYKRALGLTVNVHIVARNWALSLLDQYGKLQRDYDEEKAEKCWAIMDEALSQKVAKADRLLDECRIAWSCVYRCHARTITKLEAREALYKAGAAQAKQALKTPRTNAPAREELANIYGDWALALPDGAAADELYRKCFKHYQAVVKGIPDNSNAVCSWAVMIIDMASKKPMGEQRARLLQDAIIHLLDASSKDDDFGWVYFCLARAYSVSDAPEACYMWLSKIKCNCDLLLLPWQMRHLQNVKHLEWFKHVRTHGLPLPPLDSAN